MYKYEDPLTMEVVILLLTNLWADLEKVSFFPHKGWTPKNVCIMVIAMKTDGSRMIKTI